LAIEQAIRTRRPVAVRFRPVRVPYFVTDAGDKIVSDDEKRKELFTYFKKLWSDSGVVGRLPQWIWKRWNPEVMAGYRDINGLLLREVALDMGNGKAGSHDGVVAEMIAQLDELILDELAEVFRLRILNHASEDLEPAWDIHKVSLILKKVAPKSPSKLRPISIRPVIFKMYSAVLLEARAGLRGTNFEVSICIQAETSSG
jgi:hypothetical protein